MKIIYVKEIKTQLKDYLKNKENSGTILKQKIENDLISNEIFCEEKEKIIEYVFSIVSLLKD